LASIAVLAATLGGCAKDASEIGPTYISPITYQSYSCDQLGEEAQRVSAAAAQAAGIHDQRANNEVTVGVGFVIFWPALFFTKGNDENNAELARLKGEMDAIEQESIAKHCAITFKHAPTSRASAAPGS
jgi:hypothetical protein